MARKTKGVGATWVNGEPVGPVAFTEPTWDSSAFDFDHFWPDNTGDDVSPKQPKNMTREEWGDCEDPAPMLSLWCNVMRRGDCWRLAARWRELVLALGACAVRTAFAVATRMNLANAAVALAESDEADRPSASKAYVRTVAEAGPWKMPSHFGAVSSLIALYDGAFQPDNAPAVADALTPFVINPATFCLAIRDVVGPDPYSPVVRTDRPCPICGDAWFTPDAAPFDSALCVCGHDFDAVPGRLVTPQAVLIARDVWQRRAFGELPYVADALADAGLDESHPLQLHLRNNTSHVAGCWALDLVLGGRDYVNAERERERLRRGDGGAVQPPEEPDSEGDSAEPIGTVPDFLTLE